MKQLIVFAAVGSLMVSPLAAAGDRYDRHDKRWGPPAHSAAYHGSRGNYRYPAYPSGHQYYKNRKGGDDDEAAWAIGGLVLGAIIGSAAARSEQRRIESAPASTPLPPPQKRKVVTCYDEVAYGEDGEPYVARQCYENWR